MKQETARPGQWRGHAFWIAYWKERRRPGTVLATHLAALQAPELLARMGFHVDEVPAAILQVTAVSMRIYRQGASKSSKRAALKIRRRRQPPAPAVNPYLI